MLRRWLLLLALRTLVPGTSDLLGEVVSFATDVACCADADCEHGLGHGCSLAAALHHVLGGDDGAFEILLAGTLAGHEAVPVGVP